MKIQLYIRECKNAPWLKTNHLQKNEVLAPHGFASPSRVSSFRSFSMMLWMSTAIHPIRQTAPAPTSSTANIVSNMLLIIVVSFRVYLLKFHVAVTPTKMSGLRVTTP